MLMNLFKFKGGVKPPTNKTQSLGADRPGADAFALVVPLHQSIGGTPRPVVQAGDQVLKGQLIGEADGWISPPSMPRPRAPWSTWPCTSSRTRPASTRCAWSSNRTARMNGSPRAVDYKALTPEQVRDACSRPASSASAARCSRPTAS
jgi:electron transport complex protein RnfC